LRAKARHWPPLKAKARIVAAHNDTALLLLDLQNEMVDSKGYFGAMGMAKAVAEGNVLANARKVLDAARAAGAAVVFVRLGFRADYADALSVAPRVAKFKAAKAVILGSWGTEFPADLQPLPAEMVITKQGANPFFNTGLMTWLMQRGIKKLLLCGVATNNAVEMCARFADDAGFASTVIADCCAAGNPELHRFALEKILPQFAEIKTSDACIKQLRA
jgi:biuret amidohydrolase